MQRISTMEHGTNDLTRLRTTFALYPVTQDEEATCKAIIVQDPTAKMLLMPTHHISPDGDMMGFRYKCRDSQPGDALPIVRNMFFGHTAVEFRDDDAAIMRLMADLIENRRKMAEFMESVRRNDRPADLDCIPDNATVLTHSGIIHSTDLRSADSKPWNLELPESIGLYHAYIHGYSRDVRTHRLFIVCWGGCARAADQFCNLMIDVGRSGQPARSLIRRRSCGFAGHRSGHAAG